MKTSIEALHREITNLQCKISNLTAAGSDPESKKTSYATKASSSSIHGTSWRIVKISGLIATTAVKIAKLLTREV